ncbi:hypothetical protein [Bradyrhizobium lupini]
MAPKFSISSERVRQIETSAFVKVKRTAKGVRRRIRSCVH